MCRGQNKHGLKKIKHALLSSQETITLPVQAPESYDSRLLFRGRLLRCVFTLSGVPFPVESAVSVFLIGVKPVLLLWLCVSAGPLKRLFEFTCSEHRSNQVAVKRMSVIAVRCRARTRRSVRSPSRSDSLSLGNRLGDVKSIRSGGEIPDVSGSSVPRGPVGRRQVRGLGSACLSGKNHPAPGPEPANTRRQVFSVLWV